LVVLVVATVLYRKQHVADQSVDKLGVASNTVTNAMYMKAAGQAQQQPPGIMSSVSNAMYDAVNGGAATGESAPPKQEPYAWSNNTQHVGYETPASAVGIEQPMYEDIAAECTDEVGSSTSTAYLAPIAAASDDGQYSEVGLSCYGGAMYDSAAPVGTDYLQPHAAGGEAMYDSADALVAGVDADYAVGAAARRPGGATYDTAAGNAGEAMYATATAAGGSGGAEAMYDTATTGGGVEVMFDVAGGYLDITAEPGAADAVEPDGTYDVATLHRGSHMGSYPVVVDAAAGLGFDEDASYTFASSLEPNSGNTAVYAVAGTGIVSILVCFCSRHSGVPSAAGLNPAYVVVQWRYCFSLVLRCPTWSRVLEGSSACHSAAAIEHQMSQTNS